jgi:hypothetical protein
MSEHGDKQSQMERTRLPRGRGHSARENDDAFRNVLLLQDVEQPEQSS